MLLPNKKRVRGSILEIAWVHHRQRDHFAYLFPGEQRTTIANRSIVLCDVLTHLPAGMVLEECKYNFVGSYNREKTRRWETSIITNSWLKYRVTQSTLGLPVFIIGVHEHEDILTRDSYEQLDRLKEDRSIDRTGSKTNADLRSKFFWPLDAFTRLGKFSDLLADVPDLMWQANGIQPVLIKTWIQHIRATADPEHACDDCRLHREKTGTATDHYYDHFSCEVLPALEAAMLWRQDVCRQLIRHPDTATRQRAFDVLSRLAEDLNNFHPDGLGVSCTEQLLSASRRCQSVMNALKNTIQPDAALIDLACITIEWATAVMDRYIRFGDQ